MKYIRKNIIFVIIFSILLSTIPKIGFGDMDYDYDIVIKGGKIYNPSTNHELEGYNIGIKGTKITRITKDLIEGKEEIKADGLVVSPGFIDLISYDPNSVGIPLKALDGVTSNLAMHGGTEDATSWYRAWGKNGVLINYGASSFVTRHRWPIVGYGIDAEVTKQEDMDKLIDAVRKNIEAGALGISFSFEYVPGVKNEVVPLLHLAKEYDVPTFYHLRYSDEEKGLDGIQEVIDYGKETGAAIHIMHINSTGGTFHMDKALDMVDKAKAEGLDITTCLYPYDFWATYIDSARFRPGWQDRFKITYEDLQIGGTDTRITKDTFDHYRSQHLLVSAHGSMPEEELIMLLKHPDVMIGSDTIIEPSYNNHPRGAGTYGRLFGKYVREEKVLSMMDAIKKASYLPAKRMESSAPAMKFKGRIEVGADADITIFNPDTIIDRSTVKDTGTPSIGVEYVIVNGTILKNKDGIIPGVHPGEPIMSYFVDKREDNTPIDYSLNLKDKEEISLKNTYIIDQEKYLSITEVLDYLDIEYVDSINGKFVADKLFEFQLGSIGATRNEEDIELIKEPIIYKEGIYIYEKDIISLLEEGFKIESKDNGLSFEPIKTKGSLTDVFSPKDKTKDKETPSGKTGSVLPYIYGFSIGLILLILLRLRKTKR